jgi:hypothetical protein
VVLKAAVGVFLTRGPSGRNTFPVRPPSSTHCQPLSSCADLWVITPGQPGGEVGEIFLTSLCR